MACGLPADRDVRCALMPEARGRRGDAGEKREGGDLRVSCVYQSLPLLGPLSVSSY